MEQFSRRRMLQGAAALMAGLTLEEWGTSPGFASPANDPSLLDRPENAWIRSARLIIAEGYCPPFFPSLDYDPEKAVAIARRLGCNAFRFPSFSYVAYFPTKTTLPRHPELGSRDIFKETIELCHKAGIKVVVYNPLNHPFMDITAKDSRYLGWARRFADGKPMITPHFGWGTYYEGCLNSPLRNLIRDRVREVITNYDVDMMYYDGAYEGLVHEPDYCHCNYCKEAYQKATGNEIPRQDGSDSLDNLIAYRNWMENDVVVAYMQEICSMVRSVRNLPQTYNNGEMLRNGWTAKAYRIPEYNTFMFEAAQTPEQKLFNIRAGQSTGKNLWTYISSHTVYDKAHVNAPTGGWYSYPVEGQQLELDAAMATAAGAGYCYWGINRLFYEPEALDSPSLQGLKSVLDFATQNDSLLHTVRPAPQAGILTPTQSIGWYKNRHFVPDAYSDYYYGAFQLLKDLRYDSEPFLDYNMTAALLEKYKLVCVPNAPCLSDAQCSALATYVENGGTLLATHLTSLNDEHGLARKDFGLSELLGVSTVGADPVIEMSDLYLRRQGSSSLIPQDPQIIGISAHEGTAVLAETYARGYRKVLGPAVTRRAVGKGQAIYVASGLDAVYCESLNPAILGYFKSLLESTLEPHRTYNVDSIQGLTPEFKASSNDLLLHLVANTGNIWKKPLVTETFTPLQNVGVRVRIPEGRRVKSVHLLRSAESASWKVENGWAVLTIPSLHIYEAVHVELA